VDRQPEYAGFWSRVGALLLDAQIVLAAIALQAWLAVSLRVHPLIAVAMGGVFNGFYFVYLVYRFGGTPGKLIMGLRIVDVDGEPITFGQAFLRSGPEFLLSTLMIAGNVIALHRMGDFSLATLPILDQSRRLELLAPTWGMSLRILKALWTYSELIVLLTNEKKRALHDFLAGTVVIVQGDPARETDTLPIDTGWRNSPGPLSS
jgi:uncharacterized RDD family membrane protein YckC